MGNNWKTYRLADIASIKTGPFGSLLHEKDYKDFGTPIITVEHLSEQGIVHKNLPLISEEDKNRLKSYILKEGDIVFSRVGSVDRSSIISSKENGWLFSGRLLRVRPNSHIVDSEFLNQYFHQSFFKHNMRSLAVGGTMPSLNTQILASIYVKLPSLKEQKEIATILSTWNKIIEKTENLIKAKNIFYISLVKKFINEANILSKYFVNDLFNLGRGRVISKNYIENNPGSYPVYSSQSQNNGELGRIKTYDFDGKYITWTTDGANAGTVFYRNGKFNCTNVCGIAKLKVNNKIDLRYIAIYLQTITKNYVSYVGNPKLMNNIFGSIPLPLPAYNYQNKVANVIFTLKEEIIILEKLKSSLVKQKQGLMQKLLTGEWQVNLDQEFKEWVV